MAYICIDFGFLHLLLHTEILTMTNFTLIDECNILKKKLIFFSRISKYYFVLNLKFTLIQNNKNRSVSDNKIAIYILECHKGWLLPVLDNATYIRGLLAHRIMQWWLSRCLFMTFLNYWSSITKILVYVTQLASLKYKNENYFFTIIKIMSPFDVTYEWIKITCTFAFHTACDTCVEISYLLEI